MHTEKKNTVLTAPQLQISSCSFERVLDCFGGWFLKVSLTFFFFLSDGPVQQSSPSSLGRAVLTVSTSESAAATVLIMHFQSVMCSLLVEHVQI